MAHALNLRGGRGGRVSLLPGGTRTGRCCRLTVRIGRHAGGFSPTDEPRMTPERREIRNRDLRSAVAGDAEITLERTQHLDLARERDALDLPMRMDGEAVARLAQPGALADKTSGDFALTDLRA